MHTPPPLKVIPLVDSWNTADLNKTRCLTLIVTANSSSYSPDLDEYVEPIEYQVGHLRRKAEVRHEVCGVVWLDMCVVGT